MPQHMKKLASGEVVPCTCAMCRTTPSAEEMLSPLESLPKPARFYLYGVYGLLVISIIGLFALLWAV